MNLKLLPPYLAERIRRDAPLAPFTAARIGGTADALLMIQTSEELALVVKYLWDRDLPFILLGGGSNVLVSDAGIRGLTLINKARAVQFSEPDSPSPTVWAESGANFGSLARQAARKGFGGLEWGAGIPGTIGGAIFGNAGAHDGDMAGNLASAEVLERKAGIVTWPASKFDYAYRSSAIKRSPGGVVILSAVLKLEKRNPEEIKEKMEGFLDHRRKTQPPGASMGSMFKNPPGDFAGRLLEAAGLKNMRAGGAEISSLHANFFLNNGDATAADVWTLIRTARKKVKKQLGVELELEIERVGEWDCPAEKDGLGV